MDDKYVIAPIKLVEDQPIDLLEADHLGLKPFAEVLAGVALGTPGPFTVGVHGQWGYGKTTLLQLAQKLIHPDENPEQYPNVVTVWFNAWQFEREEHPLFPLIGAIADSVETHLRRTKASESLAKLATSLRALCRGMKFKADVGVPLLGKVGAEFDAAKALEAEELLGKQSNPLQGEMLYHAAFRTLREEASKCAKAGEPPKIVVFIDDLDRCHPDKAVHLLEGIKLVLAQPGFVFVIGVDRKPIVSFLDRRYRRDYAVKEGDHGQRYLDKIIQLPFAIPPHRTRFEEFARKLIDQTEKRQAELAKTQPPLPQFEALRGVLPLMVAGAKDYNPRTFIRLVNGFVTDCAIWPVVQTRTYTEFTDAVACALALHRVLPERIEGRLYEVLRSDQGLCASIAQSSDLQELRRWIEAARSDRSGRATRINREPEPTDRPDRVRGEDRRTADRIAVLDALSENDALVFKVLREHGRAWLRHQDLRDAVYEFARVQVPDRPAGPLPPEIESAIRRSANMSPGEPLTEDQLAMIRWLDLSFADVTDSDLQHLTSLTSLSELSLASSKVTDQGVEHLKALTSLSWLVLEHTSVTDKGLEHLKSLASLQALSLSRTQVTDQGLEHLMSLTSLQTLSLDYTQVTDQGLEHLTSLTSLTWLSLDRTQVTNKGLEYLKSLTSLTSLSLAGTQVTDKGMDHLRALVSLETLHLGGTQVTDAAKDALRKALPHCAIE